MKFGFTCCLFLVILLASNGQNHVSTYAGDGTNGYADGDTATCQFKGPFGMCIDVAGNLYIADNTNHRIRKISADGIVTTLAGTGIAGYLDGPGSTAMFRAPSDLCADEQGNIYVSDFENQYIRKITPDGTVSTVAGNGLPGYLDGPSSIAQFNYPRGICIDAVGNLFVADSWNHRIRKIDASGNVTTFAGYSDTIGVQSPGDYKDGNDTSARFNVPCGMSIDEEGNLYLADAYNHRIRKISPAGVVSTEAGSGSIGASNGGFLDGDTSIARLNTPTEVFIGNNSILYISDSYNNRIKTVENGMMSTTAGNGSSGYVDGVDSIAEFKTPRGIVADASGSHLFICDNVNHVIRKIYLNVISGISSAINSAEPFYVFPNPATSKVTISFSGSAKRFTVSDLTGLEVLSRVPEDHSGSVEINTENFNEGVYCISVFSEDMLLRSALIVITN